MSEERTFITKEKALEYIGNNDYVHVFLNNSAMLIGADWSIKEIKNLLDKAKTIEIGGETCRRMKHGIVVDYEDRFHFIAATLPNETEPAQ